MNPDAIEAALDRIGTLNLPSAFEALLRYTSHPNHEVRETAACNLGEIKNDRSIPVLTSLARNDAAETVRAAALQSMENYRSPEIQQCLIYEVTRTRLSRRPRQIVAKQLRHYPGEASINALRKLRFDPDTVTALHAIDSLTILANYRTMGES